MRFEVPQFIDIEDKIIGPFTWRQFVYLAGGIGLLVTFYFLLPFTFFVVLGIPVGALAASLAFQRVNNRPFSFFLEALLGYTTRKKLYFWRKDSAQEVIKKDGVTPAVEQKLSFTRGKAISALSHSLDSNPAPRE